MNSYRWLLLKFILLRLAGCTMGIYMYYMDAKPENSWKQQTIPLWISPGYTKNRWRQLAQIFAEVQNRTNIRFRPFIKERDLDYVSLKITTYGCYGLLGYGKGGERWINLYDECIDYGHVILRSIYQILGFQMFAVNDPLLRYDGAESDVTAIKYTIWKEEIIVDAKKMLNYSKNSKDVILAETSTSMLCNQPNMESHYWNKVYKNLIQSYPYVESVIFGDIQRQTTVKIHEHDIYHINRIYSRNNRDKIYQFQDFANAKIYDAKKFREMEGVITGLSDVYCEDSLDDCDFLHASRGHCNSFQEFRYVLCPRTCGMCGVSLRLYYITTHHPFIHVQTQEEKYLPVCSDNLQAVKNGTCDRGKLHNCLLPEFREICRRSCRYCPEQSRIDCAFVTAMKPEYLFDHPNYNYRCQYIRAISDNKCHADRSVSVNPITDCMLSCGRYACSSKDIAEEDKGFQQIPLMKLYIPPGKLKFATFGAVKNAQKID